MFLCRHLLLRVNIQQRIPQRPLFPRLYSEIKSPLAGKHDSDGTAHTDPSNEDSSSSSNVAAQAISENTQTKPKRPKPPLSLYRLLPKPKRLPHKPHLVGESNTVEVAEGAVAPASEDIDNYEALRNRDVAMVKDLPVETFIRLAQNASDARLSTVMDHLATDVVENYGGSNHDRCRIACSLVDLASRKPLLSDRQLHSLLLMLESYDSLGQLSDQTVFRLVKEIVAHMSNDFSADVSVAILLKLLAQNLPLLAPWGAAAINYRPPGIVQISYVLVRNLLRIRRDQQAFEIFQMLVDSKTIPPEAIREMNNTSTDPNYIIVSTLIKSCLHWGWRRTAVDLCKTLLRADMSPGAPVIDLTVDVLYTLLNMPTATDVAQCSYLMRELDKAVASPLPDGLIRRLYESAHQLNSAKPAEIVYEHTQSQAVLERHQYPSPQGRALTWLMRHLTLTSRNMHLGRCLAKHVVNSYEPIPLQDRAGFIALAAAHGFGLQARALWERYAVGRDREAVIGNGALMVRMVSLYTNVLRKVEPEVEAAVRVEKHQGGGAANPDRELYEERLKDLTTFAHHVVAEFRRIKEPISKAIHFDLTSLARAYFMLGDVAAGFDAFRALLDRKEVPDLYDINVALSVMAEYTPRGAARMIERMISKGVQPDPITFGTVIHFATIHRDTELVSTLISRARQLDNGELTFKSVSALLRASIEMESSSTATRRSNLRRAMQIVRSLTKSDIICSPNTGKHCVKASLDVDDPLMAFDFWRLLVQRKVEWADRENSGLRHLIARKILKHSRAGWLGADRAKVMIHALGMEAKIRATR